MQWKNLKQMEKELFSYRMLPAQHQGPEPQAEHGFGRLLHLGENGLRVAEGNLNGTKIGKVEILQIQVELRAIGL